MVIPIPAETGVIDQDIHRTNISLDLPQQILPLGGSADIARPIIRFSARGADIARKFFQAIFTPGGHQHVRLAFSQKARESRADTR